MELERLQVGEGVWLEWKSWPDGIHPEIVRVWAIVTEVNDDPPPYEDYVVSTEVIGINARPDTASS
jgi:hypothetical protein